MKRLLTIILLTIFLAGGMNVAEAHKGSKHKYSQSKSKSKSKKYAKKKASKKKKYTKKKSKKKYNKKKSKKKKYNKKKKRRKIPIDGGLALFLVAGGAAGVTALRKKKEA